MLIISCIAVLGGLVVGLAAARVFHRQDSTVLFSLTGAAGGALGVIIYSVSSTASEQVIAQWWQVLSWALVCILFAITGLFIASGNGNHH